MNDNQASAKKVFFLHPAREVERRWNLLADSGFEAYLVRDHEAFREVLPHLGDSVLVANLDAGLDHEGWGNYLHAFGHDGADLPVIVKAYTANPDFHRSLAATPDLPPAAHAGTLLPCFDEGGLEAILAGLEAIEARGRRRHVRAPNRQGSIRCSLSTHGGVFEGEVRDFCAAGLALAVDANDLFRVGNVVQRVTLEAAGMSVTARGLVATVRPEGEGRLVCVVMFQPASVEGQGAATLRHMVQTLNQAEFDARLREAPAALGAR